MGLSASRFHRMEICNYSRFAIGIAAEDVKWAFNMAKIVITRGEFIHLWSLGDFQDDDVKYLTLHTAG